MDEILNIMRREAGRAMSERAAVRMGIVSAYDPARYAAKVRIQPEDVETGWLPVGSGMTGDGAGDFYGPVPGRDVAYVHFQEGGKGAPFIGGFHFGDRVRPLTVPSGERWIVHGSGSFVKLRNDGTIEIVSQADMSITAPTVNVTGNLSVTGNILAAGDITDLNDGKGSLASFRAAYDIHRHGGVQAGGDSTGTTDHPV